jgi:peroxiredoxin
MSIFTKKIVLILPLLLLGINVSCNREFSGDNYVAYFGGEVINPKNKYILFLKGDKVLDTIYLNDKNQFLKKFDSLTPGMYVFKYEPEFQYVYFDKNDSLMVRINPLTFDESIVFCGRGDEKNNFLMELYLKNDADRSEMFTVFDYDINKFKANIDSSYQSKQKFYEQKKKEIQWNDSFDVYAKSLLDFQHFSKKEIYPIAHLIRTGDDLKDSLPNDFYKFRNSIDFNNSNLTNFSPFVKYLTNYMNNVSFHRTNNINDQLNTSINKLNVVDTLITIQPAKNRILNSIAFSYLLEDQNLENNKVFMKRFNELCTDKSILDEINKIANSIQLLKIGNTLPEVAIVDLNGQTISSQSILKNKSVIFFWTEDATAHLSASHKKAIEFHNKNPDYQFIAINIDNNHEKWLATLTNYNFGIVNEFRIKDFEELKEKWAFTKLQRTIVIDEKGTIKHGFENMFDVNFYKLLK